MSRLTLFRGLVMNLKGEIEKGRREYLSKEEAYEQLKRFTGQDFGCDARKWEEWLKTHSRKHESSVNKPVKPLPQKSKKN